MDQTETRQFQRWFGDSKVVDKDGEPLVVYHATDAEFTVFDRDKLGKRTKERDIEDFNMDMEDSVGAFERARSWASGSVKKIWWKMNMEGGMY